MGQQSEQWSRNMTTTMQRRVEALEGPRGRACLSCELAALNRTAAATTDINLPACAHWLRRTLAEELFELDTIEGVAP